MEPPKKLLDQLRDVLRLKHYSYRTEQTYVAWVHRFICFHNKRHPKDMGAPEVEAFLTHLAVELKVAASTQNQALCALVFLYRYVLRQERDLSIENGCGASPSPHPNPLLIKPPILPHLKPTQQNTQPNHHPRQPQPC
ncbi:MAG: hypothetical protein HC851_24100 [Acaryochloris sp. RU_4_1]|nr:hypothetical protein [Acaryochloris sp. RU_4_1]